MSVIIGMLFSLIGIGIFILGFWFGKEMTQPKKVNTSEPTEEELQKIQEERQRMIEDQEAFRTVMNYNADVAYKVTELK